MFGAWSNSTHYHTIILHKKKLAGWCIREMGNQKNGEKKSITKKKRDRRGPLPNTRKNT
jgi:hypothetical protein